MENRTETKKTQYLHGYSEEHRAFLSGRTASREAAFFVPHLKPGMRLLDCGCGMGALTTSLAQVVAPGEVIGIDRDLSQVEAARLWAKEKGAENVRFEVGDVYNIPFPDASFDAVFAYTVLEHLRDPLAVMKEMHRVLRTGGVAGICDPDYGTMIQEPTNTELDELRKFMITFSEENGSPYYSRHLRTYLLEAGFVRTEAQTNCIGGGVPEFMHFNYEIVLKPSIENLRPWIIQHGMADNDRIDIDLAAAKTWSEDPDAFFSLNLFSAVGWVSG